MADVFISYATYDEPIARELHRALTSVGVDTFLAGISIQGGAKWTDAIFNALRTSNWVFFIASRVACASPFVQQELGASLAQQKTIIPILLDVSSSELPGWIGQHQAIDARAGTEQLNATIQAIGTKVKQQKFWAGIILAGIAIGLIASRDK